MTDHQPKGYLPSCVKEGQDTATMKDSLGQASPQFFENQVLTVMEAAQLLRLSPKTIRKFARLGTIPHRKIGSELRFLRSELIEFLKGD